MAGTDDERLRAANQAVQIARGVFSRLSVVAWEAFGRPPPPTGDAQLDSFLRTSPLPSPPGRTSRPRSRPRPEGSQ